MNSGGGVGGGLSRGGVLQLDDFNDEHDLGDNDDLDDDGHGSSADVSSYNCQKCFGHLSSEMLED